MNGIANRSTGTSLTTNYSAVKSGLVLIISEPPVSRVIAGRTVTVDARDAHLLDEYGWGITHNGYVIAHNPGYRTGPKSLLLHRLIAQTPAGQGTDHVDGNKLNNTRANLRACTQGQNNANKPKTKNCLSQYKGVYLVRETGKWAAKIVENGRLRHLGTFRLEADAAHAFDVEYKRIYGPFARLNFPESATRTNT